MVKYDSWWRQLLAGHAVDVGLNMWEEPVFCSMFKQQQMPSCLPDIFCMHGGELGFAEVPFCLYVALFYLFIMTTSASKRVNICRNVAPYPSSASHAQVRFGEGGVGRGLGGVGGGCTAGGD